MYTIDAASNQILDKLNEDEIFMLYQIIDTGNESIFMKLICKRIEEKYPGLAARLFAQFEEYEEIKKEIDEQLGPVENQEIFH